jgi:4'-phosphopantetheinyl transferase EntD
MQAVTGGRNKVAGVSHLTFVKNLDHGLCAGASIPAVPDLCGHFYGLHTEELAHMCSLPARRAASWGAGRLALREAASRAGLLLDRPVFSTPRGAPSIPLAFSASISHKQSGDQVHAVAIVCDGRWSVGVDLEIVEPSRRSIEKVVLTRGEIMEMEALPGDTRWFETLLRFSIKESIYKAIDPFVGRYVDYLDLSVFPGPGGRVEVRWENRPAGLPSDVEARWEQFEDRILTTARVARKN